MDVTSQNGNKGLGKWVEEKLMTGEDTTPNYKKNSRISKRM
jgi:hypothetical protein